MKVELIEQGLRQMIRLSPPQTLKDAVLIILDDPQMLDLEEVDPGALEAPRTLANYIRACIVDGLLEQMKHARD